LIPATVVTRALWHSYKLNMSHQLAQQIQTEARQSFKERLGAAGCELLWIWIDNLIESTIEQAKKEMPAQGAKARWKGKTKKEKRAHAMKMVEAREAKRKLSDNKKPS